MKRSEVYISLIIQFTQGRKFFESKGHFNILCRVRNDP